MSGVLFPGGLAGLLFGHPEGLFLLPLALLVAFSGRGLMAWRRRTLAAFLHPDRRGEFTAGWDERRSVRRWGLASLAVFCAVLASSAPELGSYPRRVVSRSIDLVVCLDTSRSMLARDQKPNRFERMQREVKGLLEKMVGDRVALLAFAGDVREVAPLTHDRAVLGELLERIDIDDNRKGGTDLGVALEGALKVFDGRSGAHEAVVLLTDGGDLGGRGAEVALLAKQRGIRVYVVGIGSAQGGKIPLPGERGERFLVGPDGEEVITRLEETGLEELARATDGAYSSTERSPTPLEDLYEQRLSRLDRREVEGGLEQVPIDRFQWPLGLAVLLGLASLLLGERRSKAEVPDSFQAAANPTDPAREPLR